MKKVSFVIILVGLALSIFSAFTFFTREKVVDVGQIEITHEKPHHINWSPFVGVTIMGIGGLVLLLSFKKN